MQPTEDFTGLGMPVFTAFGWAGEETAQNYALAQLERFAELLHAALPLEIREDLPYHGLSKSYQSAYLAAAENVDSDVHISFNARPLSLETQLTLTSKTELSQALKQMAKNPKAFYQLLLNLEPGWVARFQQMLIDEDSGEQTHHQDLFKGLIAELDEDKFVEVFEKMEYLNSDDKWVTPIYFSLLTPADQAAAMQKQIVPVMAERLSSLSPIIAILRGRQAKRRVVAEAAEKSQVKPKQETEIPAQLLEQAARPVSNEEFVYLGELKPLHLRRGFINLTPEHWPFFAINARTESRPVTVVAKDVRDEDSAVWRLQPDDLARLVLGAKAHRWLQDNFVEGDYIQITATRLDDEEIKIVLDTIN